ncbi:MAG: helix-turn-helix transcriptional regulator [Clostridia bacterium]|nr:helix-turn-helix transcriptional regulator [Clostridia bacterium]MBR1560373.1 helix-turn-helix transcriptional regulator [Clostridia bacterium]
MNMREVRKEKQYTQSALASLVGVSQQQIAKYEAGLSIPPKKVISKIAQALGLTPYETWEMFYDDEEG